jgi:hypothetical protein
MAIPRDVEQARALDLDQSACARDKRLAEIGTSHLPTSPRVARERGTSPKSLMPSWWRTLQTETNGSCPPAVRRKRVPSDA